MNRVRFVANLRPEVAAFALLLDERLRQHEADCGQTFGASTVLALAEGLGIQPEDALMAKMTALLTEAADP